MASAARPGTRAGGEEQELERPDAVILRTRLVESEDGGAVALECISGDQVGADGETFTHIEQVGRGETSRRAVPAASIADMMKRAVEPLPFVPVTARPTCAREPRGRSDAPA
jgi:hypothetical protein